MLGVNRVINNRRVEPKPITLFAVIEGRLECRPAAASATAATATATASGAIPVAFFTGFGRLSFALGERSFQFSCDQRVVFGSQIKFFFDPGSLGLGVGCRGTFRIERLLTLERGDVVRRSIKLMRDPGVCLALTDPDADLV